MRHDQVYYERDLRPLLTPEEREFESTYCDLQPEWVDNKLEPTPTYTNLLDRRIKMVERNGVSWGSIQERIAGVYL